MRPDPTSEDVERDREIARIVGRVRRVLSEFDFVHEIGRGGTAVIFLAREVALDRLVAIKIVTANFAKDEEIERLFLEEARAIARLDHPNIIQIYSAGRADRHFYLVLQHVRGETLDLVLRREGRLGPEQALRVVREVASALDCAHAHRVVHRDIKPSNVMLRPEGRVKVMDFGIAGGHLHVDEGPEQGLYIGTPVYSSPEQCRMEPLDGSSDLYSLGVVLYEMLTGTVPHVGESAEKTIERVAAEEPIPLDDVAPELSPEIHGLCRRLMARHRADRFQDAASVIDEVDRILARGLFYRAASRLLPYRSSRALPAAKRPALPGALVLAGAAVALVVSMIVAGVMTSRLLAGDPVPHVQAPLPDDRSAPPIVVGPAGVDPALGDFDARILERETLYALASFDRVVVRSPEWLAERTGLDVVTPEGAASAVTLAYPDEIALLARGRVRLEGPRVLYELDLIELPTHRIVISVRGSSDRADVGVLAARIARTVGRLLVHWLEEPPDQRQVLPPRWVDLGEPETISRPGSRSDPN